MEMVPLYKPYMPESLPELNSILNSGALSYSKWGKAFEGMLAQYIGNKYILTLNTYNSAILVALATIGVKPGDEIIASPMSCLASNQPFATQHLKIVWADIDPDTGTLSPDSVKSKITKKTKAIFHNHFCGYVGYIDELNKLGKDNNVVVVDDAIEAFGALYKNNCIGSVNTDITTFSFQTVRLPNTIDGGALSFNSEESYKKALLIRDYGINRNKFRDGIGEINPDCDIVLPGYGATMNEVNSYIGCKQMENVAKLIEKQRVNAEGWIHDLKSNYSNLEYLQTNKDSVPNYWVFGVITSDKRQSIIHFRNKGFRASSVHLPNNYYSIFGKSEKLPGVEDFYSKFIALPSGWWVDLN